MFNITKGEKGPAVPRTVRFTEKIFKELNQVAAEQDVSFNELVLQCCRYALEHAEPEGE